MRKKSITMTHVARHAGVSISTVSRVVSGSVHVSEQLRQKVDAAIAELEYQPIRAGLRHSRAANIAVLIPNLDSTYFHRLIQEYRPFASKETIPCKSTAREMIRKRR